MQALTKIFVAIAFIIGFTAIVKAQNTGATANATAGATIINPICLSQTSDLHFGAMAVQPTEAGTCILSTGGVRSATGGVNLSSQGAAAKNAAYTVIGMAGTAYSLTLPATITITSGANSMIINTLLARFNGKTADAVTSTLSAAGSDSFNIGGTLSVYPAQLPGAYEGTFPVTVAYN